MNSKLVRTTRNASLITLRLFSLTTIMAFSSFLRRKKPFFARYDKGISPTNGMVNRSISFRLRIVVFIFSNINRITTGINKPSAKATNKIFFLTGAIGSIFPVGGVINRVLYAVKAWDNSSPHVSATGINTMTLLPFADVPLITGISLARD